MSKREINCVDKALYDAVCSKKVPGVVAIAATRQQVIYEGAFGITDLDSANPMTLNTLFRIGSLTKVFTSTAAVQLLERRLLGLDDPVARYLPEFQNLLVLESPGKGTATYRLRPARRSVTIRHLLTHTSGLGYDFTDTSLRDFSMQAGHDDSIVGPLVFDPGERWLYGSSTEWLGRVVEVVADLTLEEYFRKNILLPLDMHQTRFNIPAALRSHLVTVSCRANDGSLAKDDVHRWPRYAMPAGDSGLFSTAQDFMRFIHMFLNDGELNGSRVLSPQSVALMAQNQIAELTVPAMKTAVPSYSADFSFIAHCRDKWSFGLLITTDQVQGKRSAGSVSWAGIFNTHFWIDQRRGIGGLLFMQLLPFADRQALAVYDTFEREIYALIDKPNGR